MAQPKRTNPEQEQLLQTVQMFEVIAQSQPHDIQSLEILKEAYVSLEREQDSVGVSKRIAQAYVHLGQYSSAILEYEGILQKFPDDAESLAALGELEAKMSGFSAGAGAPEATKASGSESLAKTGKFEDGNEALMKFFQEHELINEKDAKNAISAFASLIDQTPSDKPSPSLITLLADRGLASTDKCLGLITEKTRIPFVPLSIYDVDTSKALHVEKEFCLRHLVLPFDQLSKTLLVATVNPFDAQAKHRVESETECRVQWYLTQPTELVKQLKDIYLIQ